MPSKDELFNKALNEKNIPILTLDNNWHRLFTQTEADEEILSYEHELNELLKKQGKNNTDIKNIKSLKKKLMDEIVEKMDSLNKTPGKATEKKLNDNKRLIEECNNKLQTCQDISFDISREITAVNKKLMFKTMQVCYEQIQDNNTDIEEISRWVDEIRIELKKKVVIKQQKLQRNQNFYTYMHNIFGSDVIDLFDMKYNIEPLTDNDTKERRNNHENL